MRNGPVDDRDVLHQGLGLDCGLSNGLRNLVGLAETQPDHALGIADDNDGRKAEATAALDDLGHAVDVDDLVDEPVIGLLLPRATTAVISRHGGSGDLLELEAALTGGVSEGLDAAVKEEAVAVEDQAGNALGLDLVVRYGEYQFDCASKAFGMADECIFIRSGL